MSRILIAEDESRLVDFLENGSRASGYATTAVADGRSAAMLASVEDYDLVILDLGLRDDGSADVMVLTAGDITLDLRTRRATVDTA